jgi:hypothetical protein
MGTSLKDALLKAGMKATPVISKRPKENQRAFIKKKTDDQRNQEQRNFCEVCETICPDVEYYAHHIPSLTARWICCRCADIKMIPDSCRQTAQSDVCRKGIFKREFGDTKRFPPSGKNPPAPAAHGRPAHAPPKRGPGNPGTSLRPGQKSSDFRRPKKF